MESKVKRMRRFLEGTLTASALCAIFACSGNTNTTGPAPPLPTGQTGSLNLYTTTKAGCYVSDTVACVTPPALGTAAVTALGTEYVSSSASYLLVGDHAGNVTAWKTNGTTAPTTPISCGTSTGLTPITGMAAYLGTTTYVYFVSGTTLYVNSSTNTTPCSTTTAATIPTSLPSGTVGLVLSGNTIYGITKSRQYFSVTGGSTTLLSNNQSLPNNVPSTASIGGVTADHNGIVFVTDYANSAIYAFYADNTTGTLTGINGNLSGVADISNPSAIATFYASNPSQSYCTTGPCEFLDVVNYSGAVAQFVLSVNGTGASTSIGYNEFNAPYTQCEIINPTAMTSFPDATLPGILNTSSAGVPYVYLGQNGTSTGPCFDVSSGATFGNGVTAYTPVGE